MTKSKWILPALLSLCLAAPLWAASRASDADGHGPGVAKPAAADEPNRGAQVEDEREGPDDEALGALEDDDRGGPEGRGDFQRGPGGPNGRMHGEPGMRGMHRGDAMGRAFQELELSKSQREQIDAIHERAQRRAITVRAELEQAGLDLRKLMRDDRPDRRAIDAQVDKISDMRGELMKSRIGARIEAMSVLTNQQREKLRERRFEGPSRREGSDRRAPEPRGSSRKS